MKEEKNIIEAISETIANAIGDENFSLPLVAWQTNNLQSDEINAAYIEEIKAYQASPTAPCNKTTALKLLKRYPDTFASFGKVNEVFGNFKRKV